MKITTIAIVVPSLKTGGMERVAVLIANELAKKEEIKVHLITFSRQPVAFTIGEKVVFHQPEFKTTEMSFLAAFFKGVKFLRKTFNKLKPVSILSFGDRYNAFVILGASGLKTKIYISNRQNPLLSNGRFIDLMNKMLYPFADGMIAQTIYAKDIFKKRFPRLKLAVVPNPIGLDARTSETKRENVILNVGRFGDSKNQFYLVRYFDKIDNEEWKLVFLGDGYKKHLTDKEIDQAKLKGNISIKGFVKNVNQYYNTAAIFAFTSTSEGFPNALGEAMAAGMAVISFDCVAGPADLIDDGINGFLIPENNHDQYIEKLKLLMTDENLRENFGKAAREKVKQFEVSKIAQRYFDCITQK